MCEFIYKYIGTLFRPNLFGLHFGLALLLSVSVARAQYDANTKFATKVIQLGKKKITVEIADSPAKREQGLMFREKLAPDHGMLFIFDAPEPLSFWMKNTLIPLAIGYFDAEKKLLGTHEMTPAIAGEANPKTYPSQGAALYALEMEKGWYTRNRVAVGSRFSFVESGNPSH